LKKTAEEHGYTASLITSVEDVNDRQKLVIAQKVVNRFGENLTGKTFAIWGLAFKPETDDMREAPSIYIIKELVKRGAKIQAYDPKAMEEAQHFYLKDIQQTKYFNSKYETLQNADAMILLTEWKEFRSPDFEELRIQLKQPIIFDGRNQYNDYQLQKRGFEYFQIGKK
jgi:UDPglucose 6-dehydrogenase